MARFQDEFASVDDPAMDQLDPQWSEDLLNDPGRSRFRVVDDMHVRDGVLWMRTRFLYLQAGRVAEVTEPEWQQVCLT
jgi:hypothetical protein